MKLLILLLLTACSTHQMPKPIEPFYLNFNGEFVECTMSKEEWAKVMSGKRHLAVEDDHCVLE